MPVILQLSRSTRWASLKDSSLAHRACDLASTLGEQLLASALALGNSEIADCSLSGRLSSAALAFEWLDICLPSQKWGRAARDCLHAAAASFVQAGQAPASVGLFGGLTGFAFAVAMLSRGGSRYPTFQAQIHDVAVRGGCQYLEAVTNHHQFFPSDYDLISGVTGIGIYALTTLHLAGSLPLLQACITRLHSAGIPDSSSSPFFIEPTRIESPSMMAGYPEGYVDCGMAHGVAGPIALLALCLQRGIRVPNDRASLEKIAGWLAAQRFSTSFGVNWPAATASNKILNPARVAWCYGNPGIARALWLAGVALHQDFFTNLALEGLMTVSRTPQIQWRMDSPTFCHGLAGLTHIANRFAHDSGDEAVTRFAKHLLEQLLDVCGSGYVPVDEAAGLLEGSAAMILTLLGAGSATAPDWDRLFLLS